MSTRALPATPRPIPALHNGDRFDADEFMRRYSAMSDDVRAELIEGGGVHGLARPPVSQ